MAERSPGPGWWLASDGKWYPPRTPLPPLPPPPQGTYGLLDRLHALSVPMQLLVAVIVVGLAALGLQLVVSMADSVSGSVTVTYEVTGSAKVADITYANGAGDTTQNAGVDVPLTRKSDGGQGIEVTMDRGQFFYISAQNQKDYGTITCTVKVNGEVVETNTSSGGYTIATCSGRV